MYVVKHFLFDTLEKLVVDEVAGSTAVRGHTEVDGRSRAVD